jgi:Autotransporter beta-domain
VGMAEGLGARKAATWWAGILSIVAMGIFGGPARAQGVFCPAVVGGGGGPTSLQAGRCTNGNTGALSTAALSSQSLSEISQSTTQQSNTATLEAIAERRKQEAQRCPVGFERVNGACRRIATTAPAPSLAPTRKPRHTATLSGAAPAAPAAPRYYKAEPVYKAEPTYVDYGPQPAVWAYGFGGYERRTADFVAPGPGIRIGGVGGPPTPMNTDIVSKTSIWGVVSGADLTFRDVGLAGNVLITGVLAGYMGSEVNLSATGTTTNPATAGNSSSTTQIRLSGPSAGAYATYFDGPFSTDLTFKADLLNINESFFESFGFNNGVGPVPFAGTGSAHVDNLSTFGNVNYRYPMLGGIWIEPTVGFLYTYSLYDTAAAALGLADGYVLRLQGGSRLGSDFFWNGVLVQPVITGLIYDDVKVVGGPILNGAFIGGPLIGSDEGKLRGQGIFAVNFDYGNGLSTFVLGMVYGGQDLFGAGGKGGLRYQW